MTKSLRKEAMLHSRLHNKFRKTKIEESKQLCNKQRNLSVIIFLKAKTDSFAELGNRIVKDNRKFWKTENPLFLEKTYQKDPITITRKDTVETITKPKKLAKHLILFSVVLQIILRRVWYRQTSKCFNLSRYCLAGDGNI